MLHRVSVLENTVLKLSRSTPEEESPVEADETPTTRVSAPPPTENMGSAIRASYGRTSNDEDVAMMLEVSASIPTVLG